MEIDNDEPVQLCCDVCDQEIHPRRNEDVDSAFARHSRTPYHLEIVKTFSSIRLGEEDSAIASNSIEFGACGDVLRNESTMVKSFSLFHCELCQVDVNDTAAMRQHLNAEKHLRMESFVKDVHRQRELLNLMGFHHKTEPLRADFDEILSYFSNMNAYGMRVCLVCNASVFSEEIILQRHIKSVENHVLKLNSLFMNWGCDESFYCIICNVMNAEEEAADEHCGGDAHRKAIDLLFKFARHGVF